MVHVEIQINHYSIGGHLKFKKKSQIHTHPNEFDKTHILLVNNHLSLVNNCLVTSKKITCYW